MEYVPRINGGNNLVLANSPPSLIMDQGQNESGQRKEEFKVDSTMNSTSIEAIKMSRSIAGVDGKLALPELSSANPNSSISLENNAASTNLSDYFAESGGLFYSPYLNGTNLDAANGFYLGSEWENVRIQNWIQNYEFELLNKNNTNLASLPPPIPPEQFVVVDGNITEGSNFSGAMAPPAAQSPSGELLPPTSLQPPLSTIKNESSAIKSENKKLGPSTTNKRNRGRKGGQSSTIRKEKPRQTYIALIAMAIEAQEEKRATLTEIYNYLRDYHEFFRDDYNGWKNSIRHNLSLGGFFVKLPKNTAGKVGKGHHWTFGPNFKTIIEEKQRNILAAKSKLMLPPRKETITTKLSNGNCKKCAKKKSASIKETTNLIGIEKMESEELEQKINPSSSLQQFATESNATSSIQMPFATLPNISNASFDSFPSNRYAFSSAYQNLHSQFYWPIEYFNNASSSTECIAQQNYWMPIAPPLVANPIEADSSMNKEPLSQKTEEENEIKQTSFNNFGIENKIEPIDLPPGENSTVDPAALQLFLFPAEYQQQYQSVTGFDQIWSYPYYYFGYTMAAMDGTAASSSFASQANLSNPIGYDFDTVNSMATAQFSGEQWTAANGIYYGIQPQINSESEIANNPMQFIGDQNSQQNYYQLWTMAEPS